MKLKNVLLCGFLTLTLIPIIVVTLLLYISGFGLSKESYTTNLIESIHVQVDYISQTIENNMIGEYRFASRRDVLLADPTTPTAKKESDLYTAVQAYLESSADKISVCIMLDEKDVPLYTMGEKGMLDTVAVQLPALSTLTKQQIMEFELEEGVYSLGVITPVWDNARTYRGSLISIYDKSYIFKMISSYYEITDTSTYICRGNGEIVNYRGLVDDSRNAAATRALDELTFESEGPLTIHIDNVPASGYYKKINNAPWYLVGFLDDNRIYSFVNQFLWAYILIIIGVIFADVLLSVYFSKKVVKPINALIKVMDSYENNLNSNELQCHEESGYYETKYLQTKFFGLMKKIMLVQHNFEGVYQLYQSSDMDDTNIDIDTKNQTVYSNKEAFQRLMDELDVPEGTCIVDRFINCFCEKNKCLLTDIFEGMRDEHLSVPCEAELYTPYLDQKWFHTLVVPMYENDRLSHLFIQLRDISSFKRQEVASTEQARRDALTGLYNRAGFAACVNKVLQADSESGLHGMLFIDMDFFKLVNDNLGHSAGDDLLCSVARILLNSIAPSDTASRFGGDEFAVFLPHTSMEAIEAIKEELEKKLVYPFNTEKTSFVISASIGVSTWNHDSPDTLEKLLEEADAAMYRAKRAFKRHLCSSDTE